MCPPCRRCLIKIMLLTGIVAKKDNEGPSDFLIQKWRQAYNSLSQHTSPRCVRSCDQGAIDVFWDDLLGYAVQQIPESRYVELLSVVYDSAMLVNYVRGNITLATRFLDDDHNNFISLEEYYTEYLCLGFELEKIKKGFDLILPGDEGIPVSDYIEALVEYVTEPDETKEKYRYFGEFEKHFTNN